MTTTTPQLRDFILTRLGLTQQVGLEFYNRLCNLCDLSGINMSPTLHNWVVQQFGLDMARVIEGYSDYYAPRLPEVLYGNINRLVPANFDSSPIRLEFIRLFNQSCCPAPCLTVSDPSELPDPATGCEFALIYAEGIGAALDEWNGVSWNDVVAAYTSDFIDVTITTTGSWTVTINGVMGLTAADSPYTIPDPNDTLDITFINGQCAYVMDQIVPPVPVLAFTYFMDRQTPNSESSFVFNFNSVGQTGYVDWGDGSGFEVFDTAADTYVVMPHTYVSTGLVEMKLYLLDPTKWFSFEDYYSNGADAYDAVWESNVTNFTTFFISNSFPNYFTELPDFPSTIQYIGMDTSTLLETVDVTMYQHLTNWNFADSDQITAIISNDLANLISVLANSCDSLKLVEIANCPLLAGSLLGNSALTTDAISQNLVDLDNTDLNNGVYSAASQTPVATLTAEGIAAKANLESKGWTVTVDV